MNNENEVSLKERLSYSSFFMGQNIIYFIVGSFFDLYLLSKGIDPILGGFIILFPKIWDAVVDPIIGILVVKIKIKTTQYIRWIRVSVISVPIITILLFVMPTNIPVIAKVIYASLSLLFWSTAYSAGDITAFSLVTAITTNNNERSIIQIISRFFSAIGIAISTILVPILYPQIGFEITIISLSFLSFLLMIPICFNVKERVKLDDKEPPTFKSIFEQIFKNKYLAIQLIVIFIGGITNLFTIVVPIFTTYVYGDTSRTVMLSLSMLIPTFILSPLLGIIIKKIDKLILYKVSLILGSVLGVVLYFIGYDNFILVLIICFIRGILLVPTTVISYQFTPDCVEYGIYKTGVHAAASVFSLQTFIVNLFGAVASSAVMFIIGITGFNEKLGINQPVATKEALWIFLTLLPSIGGIIQFILMHFFYALTNKDVQLLIKYNNNEINREEVEANLSRAI